MILLGKETWLFLYIEVCYNLKLRKEVGYSEDVTHIFKLFSVNKCNFIFWNLFQKYCFLFYFHSVKYVRIRVFTDPYFCIFYAVFVNFMPGVN